MLNEQQSQPSPPEAEDQGGGLSEQIDVHRWRAEVQTFFAQVRQDLHYLSEACQAPAPQPYAPAPQQYPAQPQQQYAAPPQHYAPPQQYAAPPQHPQCPPPTAPQTEYSQQQRVRRYGE